MSHIMRKPDYCIAKKNKATDQLRGSLAADQHLCFHYLDITIPLLLKLLAIFFGGLARFMYYRVRNPKNRFSGD